MRSTKIPVLFLALLLFGCASTNTVISDFDDSIDFNVYNTFVICLDDLYVSNINYPNYDNNWVRELIGEEIESQMMDKGHITNIPNPQLEAGFRILIEEKSTTFTNCDVQYEYDYWRDCTVQTIEYTEETLVVYVSDIRKNQVIWQASMSCNLNRSKKRLHSYVQNIVETLFNEYPLL